MRSDHRLGLAGAVASLLAASALAPTYASPGWVLPVGGAVVVVAGTGALVRRLRLPVPLEPLAMALALVAYLTAVFAPGTGLLELIPTATSAEVVRAHVADGLADAQELVSPVPASTGLVLLATLGLGGVALLVDVLAVTVRRAALAGLPLAAAFVVPALISRGGVGWVPFALAAAGYLALLLVDSRERVGRWGRPLGSSARAGLEERYTATAQTSPLVAVGRRIGFSAITLAVVVPMLVPGLSPRALFGGGGGFGFGGGKSSITTYNPIVKLKGQLVQPEPTTLLTVTTDDPDPGNVRMTALDTFDGTSWSQSQLSAPREHRVSAGLPEPVGFTAGVQAREARSKIDVAGLKVPWLPTYYPPLAVKVDGDWRYDDPSRTIFSTKTDTEGISYETTSLNVAPTPDRLRGVSDPTTGVDQRLLTLPALPASVVATTTRITQQARTPFDRVVAIQSYLTGPDFAYSLNVPQGNSDSAIENFLQQKRGYCEQYAATMAIMVREVGLASRVAVGFTRGTQKSPGSTTWTITTDNAHAWPEVYFPGIGWVPFEPTPAREGSTPGLQSPSYAVAAPVVPGSDSGAQAATDPNRPVPNPAGEAPGGQLGRFELETSTPGGSGSAAGTGSDLTARVLRGLAIALVVLVVALLIPALSRGLLRRRRWAAARGRTRRALLAWSNVRDDARDVGHPVPVHQSVRGSAHQLRRDLDLELTAEQALQRVVAAAERAGYGPPPQAPADRDDNDGLRDDVLAVRAGLLRAVPARVAWRARVLPPSTVQRGWQGAGNLLADGFDRVDRLESRLRERLHRRLRPSG